jgi:hypothetical protein
MNNLIGRLFAVSKGPWGSGNHDDEGSDPVPSGDPVPPPPAESPWGQPSKRRTDRPLSGNASLDDLLRRGRERFGGGGPQEDRPIRA